MEEIDLDALKKRFDAVKNGLVDGSVDEVEACAELVAICWDLFTLLKVVK